MREMQLRHVENTAKRGVEVFPGATTAASKSDGPIQQGQTLLCVHLGAGAVVRVKAGCHNWRLPTPYLKPALSEDSDMSRRQLRAEPHRQPSAVNAIAAGLVFSNRVRGFIHRKLGELGKSGSKQQEAAAVASLIVVNGRGSGIAGAIASAKANFRAMPVGVITKDEIMDNQPSPELAEKTTHATLGS